MATLGSALFYPALGGMATKAAAEELGPFLAGDMGALETGDGTAFPRGTVLDRDGAELNLTDWRGKVLLVNFWATWCAPCREEMPELDALSAEFGGADFEVLPVATGRNALQAIERFYEQTGLSNLPILLDPRSRLAEAAGVTGLPMTMLVDRDGTEIARMRGAAAWHGDAARALVAHVITR